MTMLSDVRVGDPIRHSNLTIFPLFTDPIGTPDYRLSDEALQSGTVTVEEISEGGSVPNLIVKNDSDVRVLFLEGEELHGAKQNRVLNTTVLVAAHSHVKIPVSCVEQGRWRYRTAQFNSAGTHSSPSMRRRLKESVSKSLASGQGHRSDQGAVWSEVSRQMESLKAHSDTAAMADTYRQYDSKLKEAQERLHYVEGATGVAVAIGRKVVGLDLFDKPETCRKVWNRLLTGVAIEALETQEKAEDAAAEADVRSVLDRLSAAEWSPAPAVGEGSEFRYDPEPGTHASALVFDNAVLHGSLVVAN